MVEIKNEEREFVFESEVRDVVSVTAEVEAEVRDVESVTVENEVRGLFQLQ